MLVHIHGGIFCWRNHNNIFRNIFNKVYEMRWSWKIHKESNSPFGWRTTDLLITENLVDVNAASLWEPRELEAAVRDGGAPAPWPVFVGKTSRSDECYRFLPEILC